MQRTLMALVGMGLAMAQQAIAASHVVELCGKLAPGDAIRWEFATFVTGRTFWPSACTAVRSSPGTETSKKFIDDALIKRRRMRSPGWNSAVQLSSTRWPWTMNCHWLPPPLRRGAQTPHRNLQDLVSGTEPRRATSRGWTAECT